MLKNVLKFIIALVAMLVVGYFALPQLVCMDAPVKQKLADCSSNGLAFRMTCEHSPPYQFLLGLNSASTGPVSFRGELLIEQSTGTVAKLQIGSEHITPCNWLPGLEGYILTWHRTNAGERVSDLLRRGQSYDVRVVFSETPPAGSSLWFSSMGKAKW